MILTSTCGTFLKIQEMVWLSFLYPYIDKYINSNVYNLFIILIYYLSNFTNGSVTIFVDNYSVFFGNRILPVVI
jgi:hypothetical protein